MSKKTIALYLLATGALLSACSSSNSASKTSKSSSSPSTSQKASSSAGTSKSSSTSSVSSGNSASSTSSSSVPASTTVVAAWDDAKGEALKRFILDSWGPSLGQIYKSYTPATQGNFFGVAIPDGLLAATRSNLVPDLNGQVPDLVWSSDGTAPAGQLAVVAVYADSEGNQSMSQHLYVFTIDAQGVGQVWITQQNQGNAENKLYFTETKNEELRQFYTGLVGGQTTPAETTPQASGVDTRNLTLDQAARWAAAHKAKGYGAPFSRIDFTTRVTAATESADGLVYIEVRENHNSDNMKAAGAASNMSTNASFYRINAEGQLELMDVVTADYQVVETSYFE